MQAKEEIEMTQLWAKEYLQVLEDRQAKEDSSPETSRKHGPADTLTVDFWPPELWYIWLFQALAL